MELTEHRIESLKKAFTISAIALAVTSAFGADNEPLKGYIHAILAELNKSDIDKEHLELLFSEYKMYMEEHIKTLVNNQSDQ